MTSTRMGITDIYTMFACPSQPLQNEMAQMIVRSHYHNAANRVSDVSPQLGKLLLNWLKKSQTLNQLWQPEYSEIIELSAGKAEVPISKIIACALRMTSNGMTQSWCFESPDTCVQRFGTMLIKGKRFEWMLDHESRGELLVDRKSVV